MFRRITRSVSRRNRPQQADQPEPSNRRRTRRPQPPPPPPPPVQQDDEYDTDSDPDLPENQYDPRADFYEQMYGFDIPTKKMYDNVVRLSSRDFKNTRLVDWDTLEQFGLVNDFLDITNASGIEKEFWDINAKTYLIPTIQFLASLRMIVDTQTGHLKVKFDLGGRSFSLYIERLRELFGFDTSPDIELPYHRPGWDKSIFWKAISGLDEFMGNKVRLIQTPQIRLLHRILASTIFAKGETCTHTTDLELKLLDMMLQDNPTKPDFTYLMVLHWLEVRDNPRLGGTITMGAYVTHLGHLYGINFEGFEECTGPSRINPSYLVQSHFIKNMGSGQYEWQMAHRPNFYLPYLGGFNKSQVETWLVPHDYNGQAAPAPPPPQWQPPPFAGHQEAGPSNYQGAPYHTPQQWYTDVTQSLGRITDLSLSNQEELRMNRETTNTRLDTVEHLVDDLLPRNHRRYRQRHNRHYHDDSDD